MSHLHLDQRYKKIQYEKKVARNQKLGKKYILLRELKETRSLIPKSSDDWKKIRLLQSQIENLDPNSTRRNKKRQKSNGDKDWGKIQILSKLKTCWSLRPIPFKRIEELRKELRSWESVKQSV